MAGVAGCSLLGNFVVVCNLFTLVTFAEFKRARSMHCHGDAVCFAISSTKALDSISIGHCKMEKEPKWAGCKLMLLKATERLERLVTLSRQLKLKQPI